MVLTFIVGIIIAILAMVMVINTHIHLLQIERRPHEE